MPNRRSKRSESNVVPFHDPGVYRAPSDFRVVALIAAFNEEDIIGAVLEHLARQGVHAFLIDHGSTDATVEEARRFESRNLLGIERFPEESGFPASDASVFHWESLLKRKEQLALELDADWFIHHDADELRESPWPGLRLCDALHLVQSAGYNAVDFKVLNFVPTRDGFARGDDPTQFFTWFQWGKEYDVEQVKCWRASGPVDLATTGGHDARFPTRRIFPVRFPLRHYPIRSQAQGEKKVLSDRQPRFLASERAKGWHVQYDGFKPGSRFIQSPDGLLPFDLERVRVELSLNNRDLEAKERAPAEALAAANARADQANARADDAVARAAAEQVRLQGELTRVRARLESELAQLHQEQASTLARAQNAERRLEREYDRIDVLESALSQTSARVAALTSSLSWKVTAPLRAGLKALRGY
jgi:chemotaxis protein histidine kinase CheA